MERDATFEPRYLAAAEKIAKQFWSKYYRSVDDPAVRDNIRDDAIMSAARHESEHGNAANLPRLLWWKFKEARKAWLGKHKVENNEELVEQSELEAVCLALPESDAALVFGQLLESLDEQKQRVLMLRYSGYKPREIARLLGTTENNVHQILRRTRQRCWDALFGSPRR